MAKSQQQATRRQVTRHQVREGLQDMILSGERLPGAKLVQQQLAKRFGVAQGVVREALLELQAYGLVQTVDNRGIFVSKLSFRTLLDSLEIREIHEGLAAHLCCERTSRRLSHLSGNVMLIRLADNYRVLGKVIQLSRDPQEVLDAHLAILRAIEDGQPEEAEHLMRTHVRRLKAQVEEAISRGGFTPRWLLEPSSESSVKAASERSD